MKVHGDAEGLKPFAENTIMLLGQNLRRREYDDAETALDGSQRCAGGDGGFAGADVALQQPAHRVRARHVTGNLLPRALLRAGKFKAQSS